MKHLYEAKLAAMGIELWGDIPGFEGLYQVSNLGRVKRLASKIKIRRATKTYYRSHQEKILAGTKVRNYRKVILSKGNQQKAFDIHVLVAQVFIGPRPDGMHVCHNNGDGYWNNLTNIRYDTPLNNAKDKEKHGTLLTKETHPRAKLSLAQAKTIREEYKKGIRVSELTRRYKVNHSTISYIVHNKTWREA